MSNRIVREDDLVRVLVPKNVTIMGLLPDIGAGARLSGVQPTKLLNFVQNLLWGMNLPILGEGERYVIQGEDNPDEFLGFINFVENKAITLKVVKKD